MIQWKQRLYAFLIRRILGPLLDETAAQQLHDSVDVSIQEGKFVLKGISLDADILTERFLSNQFPGLFIRTATIDRLEINLSLRENNNNNHHRHHHNHNQHPHPSSSSKTSTTGQSTTTTSTGRTTTRTRPSSFSSSSNTIPSSSASTNSTSSLAWRAMRLGTTLTDNYSVPAVSLHAEIKVDGIVLEIETIEMSQRQRQRRKTTTTKSSKERNKTRRHNSSSSSSSSSDENNNSSSSTSKGMIGSYIDAALASLQLTFKLTNIQIRLISPRTAAVDGFSTTTTTTSGTTANTNNTGQKRECCVSIKLSSFVYRDLETTEGVETSAPSSSSSSSSSSSLTGYRTVVNKSIEFSDVLVQVQEKTVDFERKEARLIPILSTVAFAQGNGQVFLRVVEYGTISPDQPTRIESINNQKVTTNNNNNPDWGPKCRLQRDIEVKLNHQLNLSTDYATLTSIHRVTKAFSDIAEPNQDDVHDDIAATFRASTLRNNPYIENDDMDREDLKALTGIMRQYKEAYHLAEHNQLRGGILVPTNAYLDEGLTTFEDQIDDDATYDVFFDANDQSFYNAASVLAESIRFVSDDNDGDDGDDGGDGDGDGDDDDKVANSSGVLGQQHVHTKLRLHLLSGCLKVVFRSPGQVQHFAKPEEYVLMTANDISISMSSTKRTSELILGVLHFEVEDAQLVKPKKSRDFISMGGSPIFEDSVQIGTIMSFRSDSTDEGSYGYEDDAVVSQAPCINLHWKSTQDRKKGESLYLNVTILPLEIVFRHRTMSNLAKFGNLIQDSVNTSTRQRTTSQMGSTTPPDDDCQKGRLTLSCSCPSIVLSIPLLKEVVTNLFFERSGVVENAVATTESCLGVVVENVGLELKSDRDDQLQAGQPIFMAQFSCHHLVMFAMAPTGDRNAFVSRMVRKDVLAATGRVEVNPFLPISINYVKSTPGDKENNPGRESFPIVPAISSFKARQEDDDEDIKTDSLLFSKFREVTADSRKELRGTDPQISMLSDAEKCNSIITINVPDVILDLSNQELEVFLRMVDAAKPPMEPNETRQHSPNDSCPESLSIALNCDAVTLSFSDGRNTSRSTSELGCSKQEAFSCLLAIDQIKVHLLLIGASMKHFRFLSHDPCLYTAYGSKDTPRTARQGNDLGPRVRHLKGCIRSYSQTTVMPILFRSHLFTPISHGTPSVLIDLIDLSTGQTHSQTAFQQKRIYLTLYHLTFRYNVDSDWIKDMSQLFTMSNSEVALDSGHPPNDEIALNDSDEGSMTRVFVSCADINMDYQSPLYFETVSHSIIRVGDIRFSSNLMKPAGLIQACSLSVGDVNYHISNRHNSYVEENMRLCRSSTIVMGGDNLRKIFSSSVFGTMPEAILREMGFVNVLSLDTMDAVVAKRNIEMVTKSKDTKEPLLSTSLTLGLLSIHSCKDSFECFTSTVGDLQAKLTALSEQDLEAVFDEEVFSHPLDSTETITTHEHRSERKMEETEMLLPVLQTPRDVDKDVTSFPLDGYEWTTVDHDPRERLEIPSGDEQITGWYNPDQNSSKGKIPLKIIHQHFPFHAIADPLSEGDMGVRIFLGNEATIVLKSRMLIHKLNVRVRLFDGYDWPEDCTSYQRQCAVRPGRLFVIEPFPREMLLEMKKKLEIDMNLNEKRSLTKKSQLMGELLGKEDAVLGTFEEAPLPEERASAIDREKQLRFCGRRPNLFFQLSANGVTLRIDSYEKSATHRLQSIMELAVSSMFVAETVSISRPIKMVGEWMNDQEHPRDTRFGTVMLKMTTSAPEKKLTIDKKLESDSCEITVQLLPMRCLLDQRAIAFIRAFFNNGSDNFDNGPDKKVDKWSDGLHLVPPPRFKVFKVKPWKVKVDYSPTKVDVTALREGSIVELVNISPIQRMVITLSEVTVFDSLGAGPALSEIIGSWVKEICSTQLHKFLANASPFEPITDVGQGLTDLIVLPYEAFKQGDSIQRAMRKGMKSLAETVVFQTLTTTSGLTKYAADLMADSLGGNRPNSASNPLPARPLAVPKGIYDVRRHAAESLARGFQAANYKVVVVPYREFSRNGMTGAVTSVIRGIPVLLVAPLAGTTESLSYALLGARNSLRPDIRKEEEASMSLH
jgi:hypothetical protein